MKRLRMVGLDNIVLFPGMDATLPVEVGDDSEIFVVPNHEGNYAKIGVVAAVCERVRLPGSVGAVALSGLHRAIAGAAVTDSHGTLFVEVEECPDETPSPVEFAELEREYRATVSEVLELRGDDGRAASFLAGIREPGALVDTIGYAPDVSFEQRLQVLQTVDVVERLKVGLEIQRSRLANLQLRKRIREDVESGAQKQQREYLLRQQMDAIRKELGTDEDSIIDEYRAKIAKAAMPDLVREQAERELGRFERVGESNGEGSMIRTYLDWLVALPWSKRSEERLDPNHARDVLDEDHAGLDDVKRRITDAIAVRKLRRERGIDDDDKAGVILTLAGPPGTGKTSIGKSVARAMGREFVRMSLGGVRDEAEIRGHRRTYIGALPGRLVRALRDAGTMNPVILLDEVDKVGSDWRGDPSAALLEVLDPAQNHAFRDHYLDVEIDLSDVLFLATANVLESIPPPLLDRMEVIRFDGYTGDEKVSIARSHLWPRQVKTNGLESHEVDIDDDGLRLIVDEYTREAGVRQLDRELGTLARKSATRFVSDPSVAPLRLDESEIRDALGRQKFFQEAAMRTVVPGVATGLAVTGTGGDVLFVEVAGMEGKGRLSITGQLGDVMKESAELALSYIRTRAPFLDIPTEVFGTRDFHVHVPAGAIPKDGPSAGITIATALLSSLTERKVKADVGMTGEVTLQGRVLPIGGLKQKVLAAHAAGLRQVILPKRNEPDLKDVPEEVRRAMRFHAVETMDEVLEVALESVERVLAA